jgi:hypothetical protein
VAKAGPAVIFGADWVVRNPSLIHFHRIQTLPFKDAVEAFSLLNMRGLHPPEKMDGWMNHHAVLLEPLLSNPDIVSQTGYKFWYQLEGGNASRT